MTKQNYFQGYFIVVPPHLVRKAKKFFGKSVKVIAAKKLSASKNSS